MLKFFSWLSKSSLGGWGGVISRVRSFCHCHVLSVAPGRSRKQTELLHAHGFRVESLGFRVRV